MPTVVSLAAHKDSAARFDQALEQTAQFLGGATARLGDDLVNLAMVGPSKAWKAQQAPGSRVVAEMEQLLQDSAALVASLPGLLAHALTALVELHCSGAFGA